LADFVTLCAKRTHATDLLAAARVFRTVSSKVYELNLPEK
jgi:hypothetical protein